MPKAPSLYDMCSVIYIITEYTRKYNNVKGLIVSLILNSFLEQY